jgi:TnpA family transposase
LPVASYPRQNELATALREVGRVEWTLFMINWILNADLQRRTQIGLNKDEAHHALKRAISFHQRGEIGDCENPIQTAAVVQPHNPLLQ